MSRRGTSSNPISLFSFQDIITSVTGIMILITLLMALDLSQRVVQSPRVQTIVISDQLQTATAQAEAEIRELESRLAVRNTQLQQLAEYDRRRLLAESEDAKRHVEQLDAETLKLASQANNAQKRQAAIETRGHERADEVQRAEELSRKVAELERKIEKLKSTNRIVYNPAQGASKSAWLVELTSQSIRAAPIGRATRPTEFAGKSAVEIALAFRQWVRGRDRNAEYFVLLIKPSGIDLFDQLRAELTTSGFEIGFDVVDDQVTVIDSETGAGV
jgi:hypothetical protein